MQLELSSLKKAIDSLEKTLIVYNRKKDENTDIDELEVIKAGVIQNFEFTYELCWKFMKRWIENNISNEEADGITRRELFRIGAENRLIDDIDQWMEYHKARNISAHTYDEDVAEKVFTVSKDFLASAKNFFERLEKRND